MNKDRRKQIASAIDEIRDLETRIAAVRENVEHIRDEEQEAFDNIPESLQEGDRGQAMQSAIDYLDCAVSDLDCIDIESLIENLESAAE